MNWAAFDYPLMIKLNTFPSNSLYLSVTIEVLPPYEPNIPEPTTRGDFMKCKAHVFFVCLFLVRLSINGGTYLSTTDSLSVFMILDNILILSLRY